MSVFTLIIIALLLLFAVLSIPSPLGAAPPAEAGREPYVWDQDAYWQQLEENFLAARARGCDGIRESVEKQQAELDGLIAALDAGEGRADDPQWDQLEKTYFELAAEVAACPELVDEFSKRYNRIRNLSKLKSRAWDLDDLDSKNRIYRLLYGGRTAFDEVIVQARSRSLATLHVNESPSATPSVEKFGVSIHSGDMVVSRGGAPTSALIARGSDRPGNFSHVSMVHVSEEGQISTIEAHIEIGVAISPIEKYMQENNMRLLLLRPRADIPQMQQDPMLPHKAATYVKERAEREYIAYDFEMNYTDHSKLFCSEVASSAYEHEGVTLWTDMSSISAQGLRNWLYDFGVRHFITQEPSDLEFDPQLDVVAEWRDYDRLVKARVDNATTDVMLERANAGVRLIFPWYQLAPGRLLKAYSKLRNLMGKPGPVPDGMSATAALRNVFMSKRHEVYAAELTKKEQAFTAEQGYPPPYWQLVELAREIVPVGKI